MKVGLIGTFDVDNFGDCLFPEVYHRQLSKRIPDVEFELFSPTSRAARILSEGTVCGLPGTLKEVDELVRCDAYILTGGETISIGHSTGVYILNSSTFSAALRLWLPPLVAASRESGPKFFIHSVGLSPNMSDVVEQVVFPLISAADQISFRDEFSLKRFEESGGLGGALRVDPVFCASELENRVEAVKRTKKFVPADLIRNGYMVAQISQPYVNGQLEEWSAEIAEIAKACNWCVVLLPLCHFLHDQLVLASARSIMAKYGVNAHLVKGRLNVRDTLGIIASSDAYCGSSLHGAVASISYAKPVAVLGHGSQGKHYGVMRSVGLPDVTTDRIGDLKSCMQTALRYDMLGVQATAISFASDGLDSLCQELVSSRPPGISISKESYIRALEFDQEQVNGFGQRMKRVALRMTKNTRIFGPVYFTIMRWLRGS